MILKYKFIPSLREQSRTVVFLHGLLSNRSSWIKIATNKKVFDILKR